MGQPPVLTSPNPLSTLHKDGRRQDCEAARSDLPADRGTGFFVRCAQEISRPERIKKVEAGRKDLPVTPQCALLQLSRTAAYRKPKPVSAADLELMRLIDEQYLKTPSYGARKTAVVLSRSGHQVGRKP